MATPTTNICYSTKRAKHGYTPIYVKPHLTITIQTLQLLNYNLIICLLMYN